MSRLKSAVLIGTGLLMLTTGLAQASGNIAFKEFGLFDDFGRTLQIKKRIPAVDLDGDDDSGGIVPTKRDGEEWTADHQDAPGEGGQSDWTYDEPWTVDSDSPEPKDWAEEQGEPKWDSYSAEPGEWTVEHREPNQATSHEIPTKWESETYTPKWSVSLVEQNQDWQVDSRPAGGFQPSSGSPTVSHHGLTMAP